jgi:hypothetical protein
MCVAVEGRVQMGREKLEAQEQCLMTKYYVSASSPFAADPYILPCTADDQLVACFSHPLSISVTTIHGCRVFNDQRFLDHGANIEVPL